MGARLPATCLIVSLWSITAAPALADDLGLRVPPGFRVTVYADETLAGDVYAMTLDSQGRVVITSQGWVKTLHDTDGDGKADQATVFATPATGGMGLCFDGNDLYFCGEGWFSCYRDKDGNGAADGPGERFFPMAFGEHGGHAMRKGPDGWWYLIGGNDAGIDRRHVTLPDSPIKQPEAGGILRLSPDCQSCEVVAQGFRNPYDFDFNAVGELFTYDSDCERDFYLPWYSPTRFYHVAHAGHHGWRLPGYMRSWCRKDYYLDTVDILWPVGRGSPTGVTCNRHTQFPKHYRDGVFILDWTFGKVYFFALQPDGAGYRTEAEVFLEPVGTSGFAPTDVAVAPDGSLFLSIGGRKTRGSVYRIEYVGEDKKPVQPEAPPADELDQVLEAPQPLDAWSRARWVPLAKKLGPKPFVAVIADEKRGEMGRVRAVEVMTELFGGLPAETAQAGAKASSPLVRARVAWSLGRMPCKDSGAILKKLAEDSSPRVRCCALSAWADRFQEGDAEDARATLVSNLAHADKRVRQGAARLAALLPESSWQKLGRDLEKADTQARLTEALAEVWRDPKAEFHPGVIDKALAVLATTKETESRLQAVRLIMLALGDYHLNNPPVEVYSGYSVQPSLQGQNVTVKRVLGAVRPLLPADDERLDMEASRLLAMVQDDDPESVRKVAALLTDKSHPTLDVHYLVVLSRLRGTWDKSLAPKVADALLSLDGKLQGGQQRIKQQWSQRLAEVLVGLLRQDPGLAEELLKHPDFVNPGHVPYAAALAGEQRRQAARLFLAAAKKDADFAWSGPLVELLAQLPATEVRPALRAQWSNFGLRDALLTQLADKPEAEDRDKFLTGLESGQAQVIRTCLKALEQLPRDESPKNLIPLLQLLRRLTLEPKESALRGQVLALVARQAGESFGTKEEGTEPIALKRAYQPVFDWFERRHPALVGALQGNGDLDAAAFTKLMQSVSWDKGNVERGAVIFRDRGCLTCHTGTSRLGPDLSGVTSRFSREDLFAATAYPSRDVAPAYRMTVIETPSGQIHAGIIAFESADGVIVLTGATTTVRIATPDIASRQLSNRSLMPDGLLKDLKPEDLADLYAYLQTLGKPAGAR